MQVELSVAFSAGVGVGRVGLAVRDRLKSTADRIQEVVWSAGLTEVLVLNVGLAVGNVLSCAHSSVEPESGLADDTHVGSQFVDLTVCNRFT